MTKKAEKEKSNLEIRQNVNEVKDRVKEYLVRATSFQEVGTEVLSDQEYDVLHFPHLIFAAGVIMSVYGYFIIFISTAYSAYIDGLVILILGNIIASFGMLRLLKKYWASFLAILFITILLIIGMMALWDFVIIPTTNRAGLLPKEMASSGSFLNKTFLVILTTITFSYTACFVWFLGARFTSSLYFKLFSRGKEKKYKFFIVDPWRKTLTSKSALISDVLGHIRYPFLFLLTIILTLSQQGKTFFIDFRWNNYFEAVLLMYFLLCAMVILFPAFWLLDYVRYYDADRLEVTSMGNRVLILIYGYAGFGTIVTFISRSQAGIVVAMLEFYMVALYLIPSLMLLIGGYILLTERDVYYIAGKVPHGDKVIIEYKLIDSVGKELQWWLGYKNEKEGCKS